MRNKIIGIAGVILILVGLAVVGTAFYMRISATNKQNRMISDFENELKNLDNDKAEDVPAYSTDDKSPDQKPPTDTSGAIGIMKIPKIDLKVAIGEGVDMETLKYAVGHEPNSAMAGEKGNFVVDGHRSYTYSEYFNRLDEVKKGDEIIVTTRKGEFKYKVYDIMVVEPTDTWVMNPTKDAEITLITCTPVRVATHRLIVKGKLET